MISYVRRRSNAFSRGKSQYRGVSGREGRWETRIGTFAGLKNVRSVWAVIGIHFSCFRTSYANAIQFQCSARCTWVWEPQRMHLEVQVSFGVHDEEQRAARMYDRAIILEKGRAAKTNFPLADYDRETAEVEAFIATR